MLDGVGEEESLVITGGAADHLAVVYRTDDQVVMTMMIMMIMMIMNMIMMIMMIMNMITMNMVMMTMMMRQGKRK